MHFTWTIYLGPTRSHLVAEHVALFAYRNSSTLGWWSAAEIARAAAAAQLLCDDQHTRLGAWEFLPRQMSILYYMRIHGARGMFVNFNICLPVEFHFQHIREKCSLEVTQAAWLFLRNFYTLDWRVAIVWCHLLLLICSALARNTSSSKNFRGRKFFGDFMVSRVLDRFIF